MRRVILILGWVVVLMPAPRAEAHGLGAQVKISGARVELEAYYDDDTPARLAKVRVMGAAGEPLGEGRTDSEGRWSFATPPAGVYRVTVDAGAGHRKALDLTVPSAATPPSAQTTDTTEATERAEFTRTQWSRLG